MLNQSKDFTYRVDEFSWVELQCRNVFIIRQQVKKFISSSCWNFGSLGRMIYICRRAWNSSSNFKLIWVFGLVDTYWYLLVVKVAPYACTFSDTSMFYCLFCLFPAFTKYHFSVLHICLSFIILHDSVIGASASYAEDTRYQSLLEDLLFWLRSPHASDRTLLSNISWPLIPISFQFLFTSILPFGTTYINV